MDEYVVTVRTGPPSMAGVGPDIEAEERFLREHPNLFLDVAGDGSVTAEVRVSDDTQEAAEEHARRLVAEAMTAAVRMVAPEDISSEVAPADQSG
jgi:hypothetical protein